MNKAGLKKRNVSFAEDDDDAKPLAAPDYNTNELPYKGKVFLARQKKPDSWKMVAFQASLILIAFGIILYSYYYFEHVHFKLAHFYANLGYDTAQHHIGNKYLHGIGVDRHEDKAMEWFKKAAEQGHPHAGYNLAVGHLKGLNSGLKPGEARKLIEHAAEHGIPEAHHTLRNICNQGGCDD